MIIDACRYPVSQYLHITHTACGVVIRSTSPCRSLELKWTLRKSLVGSLVGHIPDVDDGFLLIFPLKQSIETISDDQISTSKSNPKQ
jgi:hypothetical protein